MPLGLSVGSGLAIAAGVGAVGSLASGLMSSGASSGAAATQAAAADKASEAQLQMFQQQRADLAPYRDTGGIAGTRLRSLLGLGDQVTRPGTPQVQGTIQPQQMQAPAQDAWATRAGYGAIPGFNTFGTTPLIDGSGNVAVFKQGGMDGNTYVGSMPAGTDPTAWLTGQGLTPDTPMAQPQQQASQSEQPSTYTEPGLAAYGLPGLTYHPTANQQSILDNSTFAPTQAQLEATPGYQFNLSQGLKSVQSSNAAKGLGVSGAALKGAARFATGLADNTLQTQAGIFGQNYDRNMNAISGDANRFQNNLGNVLNPLMSLYSSGQSAANQTGAFGGQAITGSNNALIGGANALASGQVGSANALGSGLTNAAGGVTNAFALNKLLGGMGGSGGDNVGAEGGAWEFA